MTTHFERAITDITLDGSGGRPRKRTSFFPDASLQSAARLLWRHAGAFYNDYLKDNRHFPRPANLWLEISRNFGSIATRRIRRRNSCLISARSIGKTGTHDVPTRLILRRFFPERLSRRFDPCQLPPKRKQADVAINAYLKISSAALKKSTTPPRAPLCLS